MNIWNVTASERSTLLLWRLNEKEFKVIHSGAYPALICHPQYLLVRSVLITPLVSLTDQIELAPVRIYDLLRNTVSEEYHEMRIRSSITPENMAGVDCKGLKIWVYENTPFVSNNLKEELMLIAGASLEFRGGLTGFAAKRL